MVQFIDLGPVRMLTKRFAAEGEEVKITKTFTVFPKPRIGKFQNAPKARPLQEDNSSKMEITTMKICFISRHLTLLMVRKQFGMLNFNYKQLISPDLLSYLKVV